jgi:hypothetical protein
VVSGVLMSPLPFPESDRLVAIHTRWTAEAGYEWDRYPLGSPEYFDYIDQNRTMDAVAAVSTERLTFRPDEGEPRMVTAGAVSPSMFTTLRVPPYLGRTLLDEDGGPDPAPVAVLSYDFWQREFGGDTTVVGRSLELGWETGGNEVSSVVVSASRSRKWRWRESWPVGEMTIPTITAGISSTSLRFSMIWWPTSDPS